MYIQYYFVKKNEVKASVGKIVIGPLLIGISWILLRLQKRSLSELGFNKPLQRLFEFFAGFALAGVFATSQYLFIAYFSDFSWRLNPQLDALLIVESLRWNINSVLFEELLFRAYLLYKAIEFLGPKKACLLSAVCFGIYHWFSYGVFGAWISMIYVFILTASVGLMLAYAFALTKSIFLPIALHLAWNVVTIFVFSNGPLGDQLLIASSGELSKLSTFEQIFTSLIIPFIYIGFAFLLMFKILPKLTVLKSKSVSTT